MNPMIETESLCWMSQLPNQQYLKSQLFSEEQLHQRLHQCRVTRSVTQSQLFSCLFSAPALHAKHECMYTNLLKWHLIIVLITMVISSTQYDHYVYNFDCRLRIVERSILLPFLFHCRAVA